jgi:hypothetical protein
MNHKQTIPLLLFSLIALACALYLIPTVAAQDTTVLTDGASSIWETLSAVPGQISSYVSEHPVESGTVATTTTAAGALGVAYSGASKAKTALSSQVEGLSGKIQSVTSQAATEKEQLTQQLTEQSSSIQSQIKTATDQATATAKAESDGKILSLQQANNTVTQQKTELQTQYDKLQIQYQELRNLVAVK